MDFNFDELVNSVIEAISEANNNTEDNRVAGYVEFYNKFKCLFGDDPDFKISPLCDETKEFTVEVKNIIKYFVLTTSLIEPLYDVKVNIEYTGNENIGNLVHYLFEGNPHFQEYVEGDLMSYLIFKNELLQYRDDNFSNPWGARVCKAEDLAKELLNAKANYCTQIKK